jgi:hypothetical protein
MDISARRAPWRDMTFPDLCADETDLDARQRDIILHAYGGGSHIQPEKWGYRHHYCCAPSDPVLLSLVARDLMTGPHGVEPDQSTGIWCGAFFYLTDKGKMTARALIGEREAA